MHATEGEGTKDRPSSCEGCGACCQYEQSPGYGRHFRQGGAAERLAETPDGQRLAAMPAELRAELSAFYAAVEEPTKPRRGVCIWYDKTLRQCGNYEWRPQVCRDFDLGGADCLDVRRVQQITPLRR